MQDFKARFASPSNLGNIESFISLESLNISLANSNISLEKLGISIET